MAILAQDMNNLLTVEDLVTELERTEPLQSVPVPVGHSVSFELAGDLDLESAADADLVDATIRLDSREYQLTKEALLEATSLCGIPKGYASRTPSGLIEPQLQYWFRQGLTKGSGAPKEYKALIHGDQALGVTRGSVRPFSNLAMLDKALESISDTYGIGPEEVLVDYKRHHSLRSTNYRLIVPEVVRQIQSARHSDEHPDNWSLGVSVRNSLTGEHPTVLDGYLFAWWCTNGCTDTFASSGQWSRRGANGNNEEEVYEWARQSVDSILGGLEGTLDRVASLTRVPLAGDAQEILSESFRRHGIPSVARDAVIENLIDSPDNTMYGLMQAVTQVANDAGLTPGVVDALLAAGGELPATYGHGRVAFEAEATPELLALSGEEVGIRLGEQELVAKVRKVRSRS